MAKREPKAAFKVGDRVVSRFGGKVHTVAWVDRKSTAREDQLIKFSENYCEHAREASGYEVAP